MGKAQREKKRAKKQQQQQQHGMDIEGGGGGWQTGPLGEGEAGDFLAMDEGEAGQQQQARQPGEKVERVRGRSSAKQKARKRKSLEKALAVASRTETKVAKTSSQMEKKKSLKKLWSNDSKEDQL